MKYKIQVLLLCLLCSTYAAYKIMHETNVPMIEHTTMPYTDHHHISLQDIQKTLTSAPKDCYIPLTDIVGNFLTTIPLPHETTTLFNDNLSIKNISLVALPRRRKTKKGIGFSATTCFNGFEAKSLMYIFDDAIGQRHYTFSIQAPYGYTIATLFPTFTNLKNYPLQKETYVVSNFAYADESYYSIQKGFNVTGAIDFQYKGDYNPTLHAYGVVTRQPNGNPDLTLQLHAKDLRLSDLVQLLSNVSHAPHKNQNHAGRMPTLIFRNLSGYIPLSPPNQTNQSHPQGISIQAEALFFKQTGTISCTLNPTSDAQSLKGTGFLSTIHNSLLTLTGSSTHNHKRTLHNPNIDFTFYNTAKPKSFFSMQGMLTIPLIGLAQNVVFNFLHDRFTIEAHTKRNNSFGISYILDLAPSNLKIFIGKFTCDKDIRIPLEKEVITLLNQTYKKSCAQIRRLDHTLKNSIHKQCIETQSNYYDPTHSYQNSTCTPRTNIVDRIKTVQAIRDPLELFSQKVRTLLQSFQKGTSFIMVDECKGAITSKTLASQGVAILEEMTITVSIDGKKPFTKTYSQEPFNLQHPHITIKKMAKKILNSLIAE